MSDVVKALEDLGVKGILKKAAQQGEIQELRCQLEPCLCPEELGGATHFDPVPEELPDWMPTADHIELKSEGGKLTVKNVQLMHRLCNRARHPIEKHGIPHKKDLARIKAARQKAGEQQGNGDARDVRFPGRRPRILDLTRNLWERYPDWRFGQLIAIVLHESGADLSTIEDDQFEDLLAGAVEAATKRFPRE